MKNIQNQGGYALLLILLLIVLFVGVSAVITSASFNHSSQEVKVDEKNQEVVAAEMGVKFFSTEIEASVNTIRKQIMMSHIQPLLSSYEVKYNSCSESTFTNINCQHYISIEKFINYVNSIGINEFNEEINIKIESINYGVTEIKTNLSFAIFGIVNRFDDEKKLTFKVIGSDSLTDESQLTNVNTLNGKILESEMTINIPDFLTTHQDLNNSHSDVNEWNAMLLTAPFAHQNCYPASSLVEPYICNMGNNTIEQIMNSFGNQSNKDEILSKLIIINQSNTEFCGQGGNCGLDLKGVTIYNKTSVNLGSNFNNTSNGTFYNYGNFFVNNNLQNLDVNIVTASINVSNFKNITGKVVILGTPDKTGTASFKHASVTANGKLCINLDGLSSFTFDSLSGNDNQIIFYSKNKEPKHGRPIFPGSYQQFLQTCSPDELNLPFPSMDESEININVMYN